MTADDLIQHALLIEGVHTGILTRSASFSDLDHYLKTSTLSHPNSPYTGTYTDTMSFSKSPYNDFRKDGGYLVFRRHGIIGSMSKIIPDNKGISHKSPRSKRLLSEPEYFASKQRELRLIGMGKFDKKDVLGLGVHFNRWIDINHIHKAKYLADQHGIPWFVSFEHPKGNLDKPTIRASEKLTRHIKELKQHFPDIHKRIILGYGNMFPKDIDYLKASDSDIKKKKWLYPKIIR